ncbi:MAG: cytochrome d ubiquinol oxidase subunit II [Deltaproteobacteria bacterium CG23_combo_of_CG06-09_8_20_14_all_60_8]|nr:MAG: cytochrome d ubiquinol oxidase subunit II [Desulfobacterales bacterium CG2_30_60_27]PIP44326.1 MAG: cytochrome d ubiquinol oxidase subunit II [Deltaproteobacteria bacterium CG23_combo_of_CG06-09_8_20_14_all_60_8]
MIGNLDTTTLQNLWWFICSALGALFIFLTFVQGGQTMLFTLASTAEEKSLLVNSLGRKWELTFTTLVVFGGAMFAAFPLFYATSFGGAYWVWVSILFTFIVQAVSYEYRSKPGNLLGTGTYDLFLFINGSVGILLIGAAVGTFFSGSNFSLNAMNQVTWQHPLRGLEAAFSLFNLSLGLFLVFHARTMGALYLANNIDHKVLHRRANNAVLINFAISLPFLLFVLVRLVTMQGFGVDPVSGTVALTDGKYLANLLSLPVIPAFLLVGLILVIGGVVVNGLQGKKNGIWLAGLGTVLVGLAIFFTAGYNNTSFYPSKIDLASSLTIRNASSSHYTLTVMSYVALAVPFVVAYIFYFWRLMDMKKISMAELSGEQAKELY